MTLNFSNDASQDPGSMYACVHKIKVDEILKDTGFINKKNIELTTDLSPDTYCEEIRFSSAYQDGNSRFLGEYQLITNGQIRSVSLMNDFYEYKATLEFQKQKRFKDETGYWELNKDKNILLLHVEYLKNETFGLMLFDAATYEFAVTEHAGKLQFSGNNGTLTKD